MAEEEEEGSLGAVRYPVMPSLVALQQMRNRLHLAQLGKKLMKWTAVATGKELRRLSGEMTALMKDYGMKFKIAFMLLARARYFFPELNTTVLEGVTKQACVTVTSSPRSVSGVKVKNLHLVEMGCDSYQYLGMSKGGIVIRECKEAWLDLLRIMVLLCQYRGTFELIDLANKNATKEYKKLSKGIPCLISTIDEMSADLEKKKREGHILLKVIIEKKTEKVIDKVLKKIVAESVAEYREKYGKNRKAGVPNNAPETSMINSDITQQKTVKQQQQTGQLVAVYSATIPRKFPDNKIQSSAKIVKKTQPIPELLPSKISKQELVDKGMNLVNKMLLSDDEVLPSQLGRVSVMKDIEPPFPTESQKVFIMDQHSAPSDNEKMKEESINPKETSSLNVRQQFEEMQETAPKVNSAASENLQTASNIQHISEKDQQSEQQNTHRITNLTTDSLKNILGQQTTPEVKLTEKEEDESKTKDEIKCAKIDTKMEEMSSQQVQMIPHNETSKAETPEKVSSRVQFKQLLSKASEKKDLIVLKLPDESDYNDEFIPPVAHKSFAINANILKIEELDADGTGEQNGEAFETGEWFETAKLNSITKVFSDLAKMDSISSYELYSKCELPTKLASESHLPVCDFIPRDEDCLSDDVVNAIKQYKSSPGLSLSSGFTDLENIRYLDQFYFPDEFDDTMKQEYSETDEVTDKKVTEIKCNRRVYGFVMGSDYSQDSLLSDERNPIGAREINPPRTPGETVEKKSMFGEKL